MRKLRPTMNPVQARRKSLRRGATTIEYVAILAAIVLPLAALLPMMIEMIKNYHHRLVNGMDLPFP